LESTKQCRGSIRGQDSCSKRKNFTYFLRSRGRFGEAVAVSDRKGEARGVHFSKGVGYTSSLSSKAREEGRSTKTTREKGNSERNKNGNKKMVIKEA